MPGREEQVGKKQKRSEKQQGKQIISELGDQSVSSQNSPFCDLKCSGTCLPTEDVVPERIGPLGRHSGSEWVRKLAQGLDAPFSPILLLPGNPIKLKAVEQLL